MLPNEAISVVLKSIAMRPEFGVDRVVDSLGIGVEKGELEVVIDKFIESRMDLSNKKESILQDL